MFTTIRTQYTAITNRAANLYQRAIKYAGIADSTETRVTAAVAVCVVAWYIVCAIAWVADMIHSATIVTALITE